MTRYDEFLEMQAQETDDCILWPYSMSGNGYGAITRSARKIPTHRASCAITHGPPPTPKHVAAHSCHTPLCFNPRHLRWATPSENQADRIVDRTDNRGERHGNSKLTEFDVRAIRHYVKCGTKQPVLAHHYGVSRRTVTDIVNGTGWRWL